MANETGGPSADDWKSVPWELQNYVYYFLRTRHFPITIRNTLLIAHVLARRLADGPVEHRDLDIVIETSAVEYCLDDQAHTSQSRGRNA
ncbi:hypothetical protein [Luteibacter yeojuensis]|uniref:Uncharacterized protein n=1 Tax=Luteibacter yeojuensis TaxID=345309 RepID=A0A7X5QRI6_9GAMM|nr:hypothetical protein [Luteibacter yeojuensis]NID14107.1 hypothetical protein [Luteibacter yeojuensis]